MIFLLSAELIEELDHELHAITVVPNFANIVEGIRVRARVWLRGITRHVHLFLEEQSIA
jgi:hypothetical protein